MSCATIVLQLRPWILYIPPLLKGQPCVFLLVHALVVSHAHTGSHKLRCTQKEKKNKKGVLFSLGGRDLETAAVNGRKTMKHFLSSSEEALPGSRSMTLLPTSSSWEGGDGRRRCVCVFVAV